MGMAKRSLSKRGLWPWPALLLMASAFGLAAAPVSEYQVKAVFLFNFAHFVEWPATAFRSADAPFVIGVLGTDPLGTNLDEVARGEVVNKHPLVIERYHSAADIGDCQILFIPTTELAHLSEILLALKGRSVLTVTDAKDTAQRGVVIALITQDNRIRLRIDVGAAKAGNLVISSKLLRPAEIVGQVTG
jgi:hypothetical protein